MSWKFESPTIKELNKHPNFSLKTKEKERSSKGFLAFEKQKPL